MYIQITKVENNDVQKLKKHFRKHKIIAGTKNGKTTRLIIQVPFEFEDLIEELEVISRGF